MNERGRIGRYEIASTISQGGMGSVYLARDPQLNRNVAIKLLLDALDSDEWRRRFHREAKALAQLDHPNIVTIFDFGEDDRGRPFIVMEYVRGRHLGELIGTPLTLAQKLALLEQLCDGLDYAHQAGIVHLDVKPANLIVDASDRLRIVDFGISRGLDSRHTKPTVADARSGTPSYMAPEQVLGETIGPHADQFAAGAVAYELITGKRAFEGTLREVVARICAANPPPLSHISPGVHPSVVPVVERALSKHPQNRFPSMAVMGRALADIREQVDSRSAPTVTSVAMPPAPTGQTTVSAPLPTVPAPLPRAVEPPLFHDHSKVRAKRTFSARLMLAAGAIVAVTVIVALVWRGSDAESPTVGGGSEIEKPAQPDAGSAPPVGVESQSPPPNGRGAPTVRRGVSDTGVVNDQNRQRALDDVGRLFNAGGRDVLSAIESGLKAYPGDSQFGEWLIRVYARVSEATGQRHRSAVAAGASEAPSFSPAIESESAARELQRQGQTAAAIRKFWEADEHFATALEWKADTASGLSKIGAAKPAPETEAAVRAPLLALARAYSRLSAAAVKAAYPALDAAEARALDRSFLEYSAYQMDIQVTGTSFAGTRATVSAAIEAAVTLRSGEQRRSTSVATFVIENVDGAWVIRSASRLPN